MQGTQLTNIEKCGEIWFAFVVIWDSENEINLDKKLSKVGKLYLNALQMGQI
jgi:hypothetical protein